MIARLLICPDVKRIREEIRKSLASHIGSLPAGKASGNVNHPDILYFEQGSKLGIAEARIIKQHFALKPYSAKGRTVILESASEMTIEAQNALLKIVEELPKEATFIMGAASDANLLPTIISRCQIIKLAPVSDDALEYHSKYERDLEELLNLSFKERFEYVEKLKEKEEFLHFLVHAFRELLHTSVPEPPRPRLGRLRVLNFLKELLRAEEWAKQNVNIRAILEYLMLKMPIR